MLSGSVLSSVCSRKPLVLEGLLRRTADFHLVPQGLVRHDELGGSLFDALFECGIGLLQLLGHLVQGVRQHADFVVGYDRGNVRPGSRGQTGRRIARAPSGDA